MTSRRKITTLDKLKIVVEQARCPLCDGRLGSLDKLDFDHAQALALGGTDTLDNLRAVHRDCHAIKTFGSGATTRGADAGDIAHDRRLTEKEADFRRRLLAKDTGDPLPPTRKPKHRWPTGRSLQSTNTLSRRPQP
jgi:hypothetical protein